MRFFGYDYCEDNPQVRGARSIPMAQHCVVGSSVTANQLKDFFRQVADGSLTGEHVQAVLEHRNPFLAKKKCREVDGVIYFSVTSDDETGEGWVTRLEQKGFRLNDYAKQILRSTDFKPTSGITTEVAVLQGSLFTDNNRITKNIRAEAKKRKLLTPNAEVACLVREKFTDKELEEMGLWWIIIMHEPIKDSGGDPLLLSTHRRRGGPWLDAHWVEPGYGWNALAGFAFSVAQVSA